MFAFVAQDIDHFMNRCLCKDMDKGVLSESAIKPIGERIHVLWLTAISDRLQNTTVHK